MTEDKEIASAKLMGSLLLFTKVFYKIRTGREFLVSQPVNRESHYITICKALTKVQRGEINRLMINVPPRYGKTELCINFIAWCLAQYPDSNFIYVSYSHTLAAKQTNTVRQIVMHPEYSQLFKLELSQDTAAKDNFETLAGGSVYGVGAGGSITGRGAGIANCERFGGAIVIDDIIKPEDSLSDTIRDSRNDWYLNTLLSRINSANTPIIYIGQRTHEEDLGGKLLNGFDGEKWDTVILPALDNYDKPLLPNLHDAETLLKLKEVSPYVFAAQYQQNPQPAGGGIFKKEHFVLLDEEPNILATFVTVDTAETDKSWNDATVFTFLGVYRLSSGQLAIHILGCIEIRVEPDKLENEFMVFYGECNWFHVKLLQIYIEKKSTGTTLGHVLLSKLRGVSVILLDRTKESGSKTARFMRCQPYITAGLVSLPRNAKYTNMVIEHMGKITANNSHAHDDIADTIADGIYKALIEKVVYFDNESVSSSLDKFKKAYSAYKPRIII